MMSNVSADTKPSHAGTDNKPPKVNEARLKEMESAAAAAVAMELARRAAKRKISLNGYASAWVIQGRMNCARRWNW